LTTTLKYLKMLPQELLKAGPGLMSVRECKGNELARILRTNFHENTNKGAAFGRP
jgi:hypothetical protein